MNRRDETLRAVSEAAKVLASSVKGDRTSFDIVRAITNRGIPLVFRPLDHLWGAVVPTSEGGRGIMVTSRLGLAVQRFTLAHELGHFLLPIHRGASWFGIAGGSNGEIMAMRGSATPS